MKIKLILGLGNPGPEFEKTNHNAGHLFIDRLATEHGADWKDETMFSWAKTEINDTKLIIAKSNSFMNDSGKTVKAVAQKFGLKPAQIAVAHDDSDIKLGKYKVSFGRSSAGHKGAESAIRALKTKEFWRVRIGIRTGKGKALDFVLKRIGKPASEKLEGVFKEIDKSLVQHI